MVNLITISKSIRNAPLDREERIRLTLSDIEVHFVTSEDVQKVYREGFLDRRGHDRTRQEMYMENASAMSLQIIQWMNR